MMIAITLTLISLATWLTPLPIHAEGNLIYYGPQWLVEVNAEFRGYDLSPYKQRCGIAVMSPADLGRILWLRLPDGDWYGPCLAIDVAQRVHFLEYVNGRQEIAEVSSHLRTLFGFESARWGETYRGACPPSTWSEPSPYQVEAAYSREAHPSFYPYPSQEWPQICPPKTEMRQ